MPYLLLYDVMFMTSEVQKPCMYVVYAEGQWRIELIVLFMRPIFYFCFGIHTYIYNRLY